MTLKDFPGAPPGSWVSEEGWLIVKDEAWTHDEWMAETSWRPTQIREGRPIQYNDDRHRYLREWWRRKRGKAA